MSNELTPNNPDPSLLKKSTSTTNSARPTGNIPSGFEDAMSSNYYPTPQATNNPFIVTSATNSSAAKSMTTNHPKPIQVSSPFQPPPPQPFDLTKVKGLKFVMLDGLLLETRDIYDQISGTFKWEICESQEDRCMTFIRDKCSDKRTFLVTSGGLGRKVVPMIHDMPQLYAIYVYCADVPAHQEWTCKFPKVRTVCNDDDKFLLPQLAVDVAQSNMEWGDALVKAGKQTEAKTKFTKALENLTKHARQPDQQMINQLQRKLSECS